MKPRYVVRGAALFFALAMSFALTFSAVPRALAADNIYGTKWGPSTFGTGAVVTWSLMPTGATSGDAPSITALEDFMPAGYKSQIEAAFDAWSQVANISFVEMPDVGLYDPDIRVGGHFFDGLGGTAAHAYYPGSFASSGDVHFDTGEDWTLDYGNISQGLIKQNVFSVAMHEIGHSIGLEHIGGVFSVMNTPPTTTEFFQGLMPADVESAQTIYGPAPGYQPPAAANTTLTLTENSSLEFTISLFNGAVSLSDTTELTGSLDAWIDHDAPGSPSALAVRDSTIGMTDMAMNYDSGGLSIDVTLDDAAGYAFNTQDLAVAGGTFDAGKTMFGMLDGNLVSDIDFFGQLVGGNFDLFNAPLAASVPEGQLAGTITETPSGNPFEYDVLVQIPISTSTMVDVSLFSSAVDPGELFVTLSLEGLLEATGQITVVPEPPTTILLIPPATIALLTIARRGPWSGKRRA